MARTVVEPDAAAKLGISPKSLQRYRNAPRPDRPIPPHDLIGQGRNARAYYDLAELYAWQVAWGLVAAPEPAPDDGKRVSVESRGDPPRAISAPLVTPTPERPAPPPPRPNGPSPTPPPPSPEVLAAVSVTARNKQLSGAVTGLRAKQMQAELEQREFLKTWGVDERITACRIADDYEAVEREVLAHLAGGRAEKKHAREVLNGLRETIDRLREYELAERNAAAQEKDHKRALVVSVETEQLVRDYEGIVDAPRRAKALRLVGAIAEEDRMLGPASDTGEPAGAP